MSQSKRRESWYDSLPTYSVEITTGMVEAGTVGSIDTWIEQLGRDYGVTYLLAHADDGVTWGRWDKGNLVTSYDVANEDQRKTFCPRLRGETLQQARLFGEYGEIYLWRDSSDENWHIRALLESEGATVWAAYDESQILWGTHAYPAEHGFSVMRDGSEGLQHIVPIKVHADGNGRPLKLTVRHYLAESSIGFVSVAHSRLVNLRVE